MQANYLSIKFLKGDKMSQIKSFIIVGILGLTVLGCDQICISQLHQSLQDAQSDQSIYDQTEIDLMLTQIFCISEDNFQPGQLNAILQMLMQNASQRNQIWYQSTLYITLDYLQQRASFEQKYCANELYYEFPEDDPARQTWDIRELKIVALKFANYASATSQDYHTLAKAAQLYYVLKKPKLSRELFIRIYATDPLRFETPEMIRQQNASAGTIYRYKLYGDSGKKKRFKMDFFQIEKNFQEAVPVCKYLERLGILAPIPMRSSDIFLESYINRFREILPIETFELACKTPSVFRQVAVAYNTKLREMLIAGDYTKLKSLTYIQEKYLIEIWNLNCPDTLKTNAKLNNINNQKK